MKVQKPPARPLKRPLQRCLLTGTPQRLQLLLIRPLIICLRGNLHKRPSQILAVPPIHNSSKIQHRTLPTKPLKKRHHQKPCHFLLAAVSPTKSVPNSFSAISSSLLSSNTPRRLSYSSDSNPARPRSPTPPPPRINPAQTAKKGLGKNMIRLPATQATLPGPLILLTQHKSTCKKEKTNPNQNIHPSLVYERTGTDGGRTYKTFARIDKFTK